MKKYVLVLIAIALFGCNRGEDDESQAAVCVANTMEKNRELFYFEHSGELNLEQRDLLEYGRLDTATGQKTLLMEYLYDQNGQLTEIRDFRDSWSGYASSFFKFNSSEHLVSYVQEGKENTRSLHFEYQGGSVTKMTFLERNSESAGGQPFIHKSETRYTYLDGRIDSVFHVHREVYPNAPSRNNQSFDTSRHEYQNGQLALVRNLGDSSLMARFEFYPDGGLSKSEWFAEGEKVKESSYTYSEVLEPLELRQIETESLPYRYLPENFLEISSLSLNAKNRKVLERKDTRTFGTHGQTYHVISTRVFTTKQGYASRFRTLEEVDYDQYRSTDYFFSSTCD